MKETAFFGIDIFVLTLKKAFTYLPIESMIKKNVIIRTKDIIEQTKISDRTVRRILKKLVDNKIIESVGNTEYTQIKNINWQSNGRVTASLKFVI